MENSDKLFWMEIAVIVLILSILFLVHFFIGIGDANAVELPRNSKIIVSHKAVVLWDIPPDSALLNGWMVYARGPLGEKAQFAYTNQALVDCSNLVPPNGIERVYFWVTAYNNAGESAPSDTVDMPMAKTKFLFGDLNADSTCDVLDSAILWSRGIIGTIRGSPNFDGRMDVDANGVIDVMDHIAFIYNLGRSL